MNQSHSRTLSRCLFLIVLIISTSYLVSCNNDENEIAFDPPSISILNGIEASTTKGATFIIEIELVADAGLAKLELDGSQISGINSGAKSQTINIPIQTSNKVVGSSVYTFTVTDLKNITASAQFTLTLTEPNPDEPNLGDTDIRLILDDIIQKNNIPGMIGAITNLEGVQRIGVSGIRSIEQTDLIEVDDLFHLGSCTKAMTSMLIATLVDDGLIDWNSTISGIFPNLIANIDPSYHDVTVWDLLTHNGGIQANASNWWDYGDLSLIDRREAIMLTNLSAASGIQKGTYNYSNLSYMIAGHMAEKITGKTWEALMQERIFNPLGMTSAGFGPPGSEDIIDQPRGHNKSGPNWVSQYADNAEALGPAGTVHASFSDWAKFIAIQLDPNQTIISATQKEKLITPTNNGYGGGWGIFSRTWANGLTLSHSGSNTMWYVVAWVAPNINRAYVVGTNSYSQGTETYCDQVVSELIGLDQK